MSEIPQTDPPLTYVSIDPGETSGWALYNEAGRCIYFGQIGEGAIGLDQFLEKLPATIRTVIYEEYRIDPKVKQGGTVGVAMQAIGVIEAWARRRMIRCVDQHRNKKNIGYKRLKITPPKNHAKSHQTDALAHGEFWLWANNIRENYAKAKENE
jgi:hypothetical protein